jgi:hypothetical protein
VTKGQEVHALLMGLRELKTFIPPGLLNSLKACLCGWYGNSFYFEHEGIIGERCRGGHGPAIKLDQFSQRTFCERI